MEESACRPSKEWLINFLQDFEAYVEPDINFNDLDRLEFSLPNYIKSNRESMTYVFLPGSTIDDVEKAKDIIMVSWKIEEEAWH